MVSLVRRVHKGQWDHKGCPDLLDKPGQLGQQDLWDFRVRKGLPDHRALLERTEPTGLALTSGAFSTQTPRMGSTMW